MIDTTYFGLPYGQTEVLMRKYDNTIPNVSVCIKIHKRISRLDIWIDTKVGNNIVIVIDSTGIKVANYGKWMHDRWNRRRRFIKIHVGVYVISEKIYLSR